VPLWVNVLLAAEAWGVPPWEVERGSAKWFTRWMTLTAERARAENDKIEAIKK